MKKKLTAAEMAARYERQRESARKSYRKHAEERKNYQRKRYRAMAAALKAKKK